MGVRQKVLEQLKNLPDDDVRLAAVDAALRGISVPWIQGAAEPEMREPEQPYQAQGKVNPLWIVEQRDGWIEFNRAWFNYFGQQHPRFTEQMRLIREMAEQHGVDLLAFSPETFSLSDIREKDDIFGATEQELRSLLRRIEESHEAGLKQLDDAKKKRWSSVLRLAVKVQDLCRSPRPPRRIWSRMSRRQEEVWRLLHPLRYFLYTVRSNLLSRDGTAELPEAPSHIVMMCLVISLVREHAVEQEIQGVLIQIPPRHGKTTFTAAERAFRHKQQPWQAVSVLHNNLDRAVERLDEVRDHFDPKTRTGRRSRALFGGFDIDLLGRPRSGREVIFLREKGERPCQHKEGNLHARGVHTSSVGITCHELWIDDPTSEKEAMEPGTRERTNTALDEKWMTRLTGRGAIFIYICTSWHPDDYASRLKKRMMQGAIRMAYYAEACGGPDEDFRPIWEVAGYGRSFLKSKYLSMGPARYAAIYQNDPDSDEARKLARLHFFDWDQWLNSTRRREEWMRFFLSPQTEYYYSLDPSGTESRYSNLAGITLSAFGILRVRQRDGRILELPKLVFLRFWSFAASQHRLARTIAKNRMIDLGPEQREVDYVIVEATSGYHATADDLIESHGFETSKVITRSPGTGTKAARFLRYALHVETGDVLFPGRWGKNEYGEKELHLLPDWEPMAEQLLRAGSVVDTNLLDCVRQQLSEVAHRISQLKGEYDPDDDRHRILSAEQQRRLRFWQKVREGPARKPKVAHLSSYGRFLEGGLMR